MVTSLDRSSTLIDSGLHPLLVSLCHGVVTLCIYLKMAVIADSLSVLRSSTSIQATARMKDILDVTIFEQLFELDELYAFDGNKHKKGNNPAFSREIVSEYYDQARKTFERMDAAL